MNIIDIITQKRDGNSLSSEQIRWAITNYVAGRIPDYQMSALLMAIYFRGMNPQETISLTQAMIDSGDTIDLSSIPGIKVDKHSTGGVGDKVSLILAPLVAAAGIPVPMMSGRGLGHTGGTLDKLEAIPGFKTNLSEQEFRHQIRKIGFAMIGQTEKIVPADRKIYALRDVTATVPSLPLICSSIISKKKAEGTNALVLDIKVGKGAFFRIREETVQLAEKLIALGNNLSIKTMALLTSMDQPLGQAVGNWVETNEAIRTLQGHGPSDLIEVVRALGGIMLVLGKKKKSVREGMQIIQECLDSGKGFKRFVAMVKMQGGDLSVVENPENYPLPRCNVSVESPCTGYVTGIDALKIGLLAVTLGAGRVEKEDRIDPGAGILLHKKVGDPVEKSDLLATFYTNKENMLEESKTRLLQSYTFSEKPVSNPKLIDIFLDEAGELPFP